MSSAQPAFADDRQARRAASRRHAATGPEPQYGLLPLPPTDREKYAYAKRHLWVLTLSSLVSFCCLVASQFKLAQSTPWMWLYMPLLIFTVLYYLVSLRVNALTRDFDVKAHKALVRDWHPEVYPSVDVFLPVCGEPIEVLHNTWAHVRAMADHYPGICVPFVLDDGASPELEAMAADFGFRYGTRPNRGWFKKAGNLHFGFEQSDGEFILILDADFTPRADLLEELVPYLHGDENIGIVQSPQFFRVNDSQNWIERGAGAVQELFYRSVQISRQGSDGAICVGSCAIYRRAALDTNGGTTLIEHSEDVHTGFDLRRLGWDLRYVPVPVATGVCPDSAGAFFNQQYRWCSGSMSLLGSRKFREAKIKFSSRMCYMSGFFYYIHTALFTFAAPVIPIVLLLTMPDKLRVENLLLVVPSLLYTTIIFPMWHRAPYRLEAWAARMMYGWAHVFAIWDILRKNRMGWQPTGSSGAKKNKTRRFWVGMWVWGGGTALVWVAAAVYRMFTMYPPNFALVLSSGLFYAVVVGRVLVQPRTEQAA
jgi:cellulose synthase (UDP-forming)